MRVVGACGVQPRALRPFVGFVGCAGGLVKGLAQPFHGRGSAPGATPKLAPGPPSLRPTPALPGNVRGPHIAHAPGVEPDGLPPRGPSHRAGRGSTGLSGLVPPGPRLPRSPGPPPGAHETATHLPGASKPARVTRGPACSVFACHWPCGLARAPGVEPDTLPYGCAPHQSTKPPDISAMPHRRCNGLAPVSPGATRASRPRVDGGRNRPVPPAES